MAEKNVYPIRYVVRKTGLTPHLIRSWEKRHGAVAPKRTGTNRRLYSAEDIEKLKLLSQAVNAGNSIGQIASLNKSELQELSGASGRETSAINSATGPAPDGTASEKHYEACLDAVTRFDPAVLEKALNSAVVELNRIHLLQEVVIPLIEEIGEAWAGGAIKIYQEHAASSVLRTFLGDLLHFSDAHPAAPDLLVATPANQHHELGALIAAVAAAHEGWRVRYLGPDLPSEEIAGAAERVQPKAVCLSLVFPADDPKVVWEIKKLHRFLPKQTRLIIGGRAAGPIGVHLEENEAEVVQSIPDFLNILKLNPDEI